MPYQREQRGSRWSNGFAIGFPFQKRRTISRIYFKAASPCAFAFLVWSVEDNPVLPAALENTQKPRLVPSQTAVHTALNLSCLPWEVNGYLWDCTLYKAKHTLSTWSRTKKGQPLSQEKLLMAAVKTDSPSLLTIFVSAYPSVCFDYAFLKIFQHFFLAALLCVPSSPVHTTGFIRMNLELAQAGMSWSRGSHQGTLGTFYLKKLGKPQC